MTTQNEKINLERCPTEELLKLFSGKWKPWILRLAVESPLRFNTLLHQLHGSNKQSVAAALKELVEAGLLVKTVVKLKPLHIEYCLSEKGRAIISVFKDLEGLLGE